MRFDDEGYERKKECLAAWADDGVVDEILITQDVEVWRLTDIGVNAISSHYTCGSPQPVLALREIACRDMTMWELSLKLEQSHWTHAAIAKKASLPKPYCIGHGNAVQTWFTIADAKAWSRDYLLCLCESAALASREVHEIPHLAEASTYSHLLDILYDRKPKPCRGRRQVTVKILADDNDIAKLEDGDDRDPILSLEDCLSCLEPA